MEINFKDAPLYKFVTSYRNIYRAIYALESYIEELQLLNEDDLKLYYALHDKYNWDVINRVIEDCQGRITKIIDNPDKYFKTSVYFALKKFEDKDNKVKFRPLHTARLKDQICMVAMLQILMFVDSDEEDDNKENRDKKNRNEEDGNKAEAGRAPSDLLKSIPDNFYGNRASIRLESIYQKWAPNYQAYNQKIIESCGEYSKSHKYEYEVSLDIKEFFPSISPFFLFVNICNVLKERLRHKQTDSRISENEEKNIYRKNFEVLKRITAKLLFLEIKDPDYIRDKELEYYFPKSNMNQEQQNEANNKLLAKNELLANVRLFAKGVAQGLPQSYFFGNLCMAYIRKEIVADDMFKGKDYFYVDDSVIYVKGLNKEILEGHGFYDKIGSLNKNLQHLTSDAKIEEIWKNAKAYPHESKTSNIKTSEKRTLLDDLKECGGTAADFHKKIEYTIKFHDSSKSTIQTIDAANRNIKSLGGLGRNASCADSFFMEYDDRRISKKKMNALNDYAWEIINQIEEEEKSKKSENDDEDKNKPLDTDSNQLQLKVFKRFRKIFLSRNMWLDTMDAGEIKEYLEEWFDMLLSAKRLSERKQMRSPAPQSPEDKETQKSDNNTDEDNNKASEDKSNHTSNTEDTDIKFSNKDKKTWFELTDKESFRAEAAQLLKCSSLKEAENLKEKINSFEEIFSGVSTDSYNHLYFHKYLDGVIAERGMTRNRYASLHMALRSEIPAASNIDTAHAIGRLRKFIFDEFHFIFSSDAKSEQELADTRKKYPFLFKKKDKKDNKEKENEIENEIEGMQFMKVVSDEFKRRILNAFFSVMIGVNPSEEVPFVKTKGGNIDYASFRILVWLRNPNFDINDFWHFLSKIEPHALPERMMVDNGLPEVVKIFMTKVVDPGKVDDLIKTHRIVKGLWQNGSKFLNSYTLHNEEHAVKLITLAMNTIRRIDYFQLKQLDYYILFLACYLHDISMVIHPDLQRFCHAEEENIALMAPYLASMKNILKQWESTCSDLGNSEGFSNFWKSLGGKMVEIFNEVYEFHESRSRNNHPKDSALFIKNKRHDLFKYLEETIVEAVARAGEDHGKEIHHVYDLRSSAKNDTTSAKYISILLRLADLMDISNDRINYHLLNENVSHLSEKSRFHWISHLVTDEIQLIPHYEIGHDRTTYIDGDEIKEKNEYYIRETLRFYIILNMKSLEPIKRKEGSCRKWHKETYKCSETPVRYNGFEGIKIRFDRKPCEEKECPMVCRWMNEKLNWMLPELERLQKYLNTVNYEPFRTEIEVDILFKDYPDINIKPSLFDDVRRHLTGEHNE